MRGIEAGAGHCGCEVIGNTHNNPAAPPHLRDASGQGCSGHGRPTMMDSVHAPDRGPRRYANGVFLPSWPRHNLSQVQHARESLIGNGMHVVRSGRYLATHFSQSSDPQERIILDPAAAALGGVRSPHPQALSIARSSASSYSPTEPMNGYYPPATRRIPLWCKLYILCGNPGEAPPLLGNILAAMSDCALTTRLQAGLLTAVNARPTSPNPGPLDYRIEPTPNGQIMRPRARTMASTADGDTVEAFGGPLSGRAFRFTAVLIYSCECDPRPRIDWEMQNASGKFEPDPTINYDAHTSANTCTPQVHMVPVLSGRWVGFSKVCAIAATDTPTKTGTWRITGTVKWNSAEGECEPQECQQQAIVRIFEREDGTLACSVQ